MKPLITVKQACEMLSIGKSALYVLISQRKIGTVKIGASVRFIESDLDAFIAERYREPYRPRRKEK
jgi:excisionase family DNA binding protein